MGLARWPLGTICAPHRGGVWGRRKCMRRPRSLSKLLGAAAVAGLALTPVASAQPARPSAFSMGVPTIVDPVRGVGEPIIAIDNDHNAWISGPGGSSTQTSFFWHSNDGGQTYPLSGLPGGHWLCSSGGGDSHLLVDHVNGDVYLTAQQAPA